MKNRIVMALVAIIATGGAVVVGTPAQAAAPAPAGSCVAVSCWTPASAPAAKPEQKVEVSTGVNGKVTTTVDGAPVPAATDAVETAEETGEDSSTASAPFFQGWRFLFRDVCIVDVQNSSLWDAGTSANSWESGTNTVVTTTRTAAATCNDFPAWQRLRVYSYSSPDNRCTKVSGYTTPATGTNGPFNGNYDRLWTGTDGGPKLLINMWYYAGCRDTQILRNHEMTSALGVAFGLGRFTDSTNMLIAAMNMSNYSAYNVSYAQALDRNRLYALMHAN